MARSLADELEQAIRKLDLLMKSKGNKSDLLNELRDFRTYFVEILHDLKRGKL